MTEPGTEGDDRSRIQLRTAALATSASILVLQQRAEQELLAAKQALEERTGVLTRSFSLLSATLESMPYGIVALDLEGAVISYNSRLVAIWQLPMELLGRRDGALLDAHIAQQVRDPRSFLERVRTRQADPEAEGFDVVELRDGRTFERHVFPQRVEQELVGVVISWRDITERQQLEAQLRQSQKMEAVGTLAAGIAHDFNNLLNAIMGYAELADASLPPDAPQHEDLAQILVAGERAATLTRQLLTFARRLPADPRPVDLGAIVAELDKLLRRLIDPDIEVATDIAEEPWPILADPAQMDQVIMNLAINARDAMPQGGRLILGVANVHLDHGSPSGPAIGPGDYVQLTVSDTGSGMTAEVLEHAFEPFYTTKRSVGSGLGLATVYGIVERHGGRILTETAPGAGTTFRILFPRTSQAAAPGPLPQLPGELGRGETILLVEDDPSVRAVTRRTLTRLGYRVVEAQLPAEAIALARDPAQPIDLLLSDVMMPVMQGTELAAQVRSLRPPVPVLLMSGYTDEAVGGPGPRADYGFIAKPFTGAQLAEQVRRALDRPAGAELAG